MTGSGVRTAFLGELGDIVGGDHVLGGEDLAEYRLGVDTPSAVVFPGNESEVSRLLTLATREGLGVVPWGGGTHQSLGNPPARYDLAVGLRRLDRLIEHEPGDMTATVQAGMRFSDLQRQLEARGQFIPLDPPLADRASLGGVLAANLSGPLRCRYGTARDLVLGVRIAHADGTITKGGAKVVKNATAYDITKLYVGAYGTLGVILEATVRLFPRPAAERGWWLSLPDLAQSQALAIRILGSHLRPNRVELLDEAAGRACGGPGRGVSLLVSCAGVQEAVQAQGAELEAMARESEASITPVSDSERTWALLRDFPWVPEDRSSGRCLAFWRGSLLPSDCAKGLQATREATDRWAESSIAASVAHGILRGACRAETTEGVATSLMVARDTLTALGGFLIVLDAPARVREQVDAWGPPADGLDVMRRLKTAFDPKGTLNPGRFVGRI